MPERIPSVAELTELRAWRPAAVAAAVAARKRRPLLEADGRLMIVAADHQARGALGVRGEPMAMASRVDLLDRLEVALSRPGVDGVLATPDIMEDLILRGALDGKVVIGSMNRGGLQGAAFELDDRFTAYDADAIDRAGFNGGKMLCRIDLADPASVRTLEHCGRAISALARRGLAAMIEPFWSYRADGRVRNDLTANGVIRSVHVAQGLGTTSAYTWLKLPVVAQMDRVMAATTLPTLLLGGDPSERPEEVFASWEKALRLPSVRGLIVGRTLLFPPGGDVAAAVDTAVGLIR